MLKSKKIRLIYAGGLTKDRGLFLMLDSLKKLRNKAHVTLTLIGWFDSDTLKEVFFRKVKDYGLFDVVEYKGILPHRETINHMMESDIGLFLMPEKGAQRVLFRRLRPYFVGAIARKASETLSGSSARPIVVSYSGSRVTISAVVDRSLAWGCSMRPCPAGNGFVNARKRYRIFGNPPVGCRRRIPPVGQTKRELQG